MEIKESRKELKKCSKDTPCFSFHNEIHLAKVVKCYDGDTIHCVFLHNGGYYKFSVRLYGYDSPEMRPSKSKPLSKQKAEKLAAIEAKERLEELILNKCVYLICLKPDKYGRILGIIKLRLNDELSVNGMMIEEGHGYAYYGGTKKK